MEFPLTAVFVSISAGLVPQNISIFVPMDLSTQDIRLLNGVGSKKAEVLKADAGVYSYHDFLYFFPYKHIDRSRFYTVRELRGSMPYVQLYGCIRSFKSVGEGRKKRLTAQFVDKSGSLELVWFKGGEYVQKNVTEGQNYVVFGKPAIFNRKVNMAHPEIESPEKFKQKLQGGVLMPVYNTSERMKKQYLSSKGIQRIQANLRSVLGLSKISESLPGYLVKQEGLMSLDESLKQIHFPESAQKLAEAQSRLKFEELFFIQVRTLRAKHTRMSKYKGLPCPKVGQIFNEFFTQKLPFELTDAQKRVIREIRSDMSREVQMNRLLQGDVGSGKTLVALMVMLIALDNGYQACIMAPTEILANQHLESLTEMMGDLNVNIRLLTGSTKKAERTQIHSGLLDGSIQILVGTHALLEDVVQFKNLGLAVIDEQHRFGVAQRSKLWNKNQRPPHVLVMTATPIPRTLAMTVYGDLDVSIIDELPPGRRPIKTVHFFENRQLEVEKFMKEEIAKGRQVYVVYPLIQESEKLDMQSLEAGFEHLKKQFPEPTYSIGMVHGKLRNEDKEAAMNAFASGQTQILIATTVIEVGVNVPNASVMVINSTQRFGLSQLHQLRGRVGRGAEQSYCVLMSSFKIAEDSKKRIQTMVETNDGFEIAEADLKLRGPGDIEGTQQSGIPIDLKIASLTRDGQILQHARNLAMQILQEDPSLQMDKNAILPDTLRRQKATAMNWSSIS